jgi:hypothetical protein
LFLVFGGGRVRGLAEADGTAFGFLAGVAAVGLAEGGKGASGVVEGEGDFSVVCNAMKAPNAKAQVAAAIVTAIITLKRLPLNLIRSFCLLIPPLQN